MGCDIHICIQAQDPDGAWVEIVYQDEPYEFEKARAVMALPNIPVAPVGFHERDYDLFGILADVRNGTGFAGCTTGEGWPSIAPNRGWPDGFNPEAVADNPKYPGKGPRSMGDHSETWVTLDELKAFDWDGVTTTLYGVVSADEYERLSDGEKPREWSGGISGLGIAVYDRPRYLEAKRMRRLAKRPYVGTNWKESARSATNDWPGKVIPWLTSLAAGRPLRLVLGFDS